MLTDLMVLWFCLCVAVFINMVTLSLYIKLKYLVMVNAVENKSAWKHQIILNESMNDTLEMLCGLDDVEKGDYEN